MNGAVDMLQLQIPAAERDELRPSRNASPREPTRSTCKERATCEDYDKPDNIDTAVNLFQQALQLDPTYAPAYASLGDAYWKKYLHTKDVRLIAGTRAPCDQARHLDEKLSAAHECLGTIAAGTGHYEEAVNEFRASARFRTDERRRVYRPRARLRTAGQTGGGREDLPQSHRPAPAILGRIQFAGNVSISGRMQYWQSGGDVQQSRGAGAGQLSRLRQPRSRLPWSRASIPRRSTRSNIRFRCARLPTRIRISVAAYFYMRRFDDAAANYEQSLKLGRQ